MLCDCEEREREMFYLMTHSTHFIYGYMVSDIWLRTILMVRKETRCHHIGYSFRLTARVLLYAPSHRQDNIPQPLLQSWSTGWKEKYLNGSTPWRIDPTTHRTMSERSTSDLRPAPIVKKWTVRTTNPGQHPQLLDWTMFVSEVSLALVWDESSLVEGRKKMFYLTTPTTHFIFYLQLDGVRHMVKEPLR